MFKLPFRTCVIVLALFGGLPNAFAQQPISREIPPDVTVITDLLYARYGERVLYLNLYLPRHAPRVPALVLLVQGGGMANGQRETFGPIGAALAQRGFAAASIDYRGASEALFPATVHDIKAAARWLRANANAYNFSANKIGILGGSYGAQMAIFSAVTAGVSELEGEGGNPKQSSKLDAIVALSGVSNVQTFVGKKFEENVLGASLEDDPELWQFASASTHVTSSSPPILLIASDTDTTVPLQQSEELKNIYKKVGAPVEFHIFPGAHHAFWNYKEWFNETMDMSAAFFENHLNNH